jgi:solute carrier family 44 (choline transporter-like protein), member 1
MSMTGDAFCDAGKRAYTLIENNVLGIIAVQSIGDFVLVLARIFIVLFSMFVGFSLIEV